VRQASLAEGDRVVFRFNDRSQGSPGSLAPLSVTSAASIHVGIDSRGTGSFAEIDQSPLSVSVIADHQPARYLVLAPSVMAPGEATSISIVALDACGNLAPAATAHLEVAGLHGAGTQAQCFLTPLDGGRRQLSANLSRGLHRIHVADLARGIEAVSNPILSEADPRTRVFWGDVHNHAYDSSLWHYHTPTTDPDYNYRYGRDVGRLDFMCLNFHLFLEFGFEGQERAWQMVQEAAMRSHQPHAYVTFSGLEYHGFGGDRCLILNGDQVPAVSLQEIYRDKSRRPLESEADLRGMYDYASNLGAMVTCHVGGTPSDLRYHDARVQWNVEVASMHGNFEWFGHRALARGLRVGFHGSSDGHVQTPGHPRRPGAWGRNADLNRRDTGYGSGALMAVLAPNLTREALWEAFAARRTYGTTGARILLDFKVNGQSMGSELTLEGAPRITADVVGTAPIERVELIRNDSLILDSAGERDALALDFEDTHCPQGDSFYYLRVTQLDGEFAWSSPIWVRRLDQAPADPGRYPAWNADDPAPASSLAPHEASIFEQRLLDYLRREEDASRWDRLRAVRVVPSPMGRYTLILAHDHKLGRPVHFKLFLDYQDIVLRMDLGHRDYGQSANLAAMIYADYEVDTTDPQ
jgi:hypothetical protein